MAIHTSKLEGVNNKIKVIKRRAYGYHDLCYFELKVLQAFAPEPLNKIGEEPRIFIFWPILTLALRMSTVFFSWRISDLSKATCVDRIEGITSAGLAPVANRKRKRIRCSSFKGYPNMDRNGDQKVDIADVVYQISHPEIGR